MIAGARERITPLIAGAVLLAAATGCGGSPDSDDTGASDPGTADVAASQAADDTAGSADTHHDGEGVTHTHGGDSHTHAAADTLDVAIPLAGTGDGSATGTVTVMARGDTLRLHVSLEGAEPGTRHSARLVAGSCDEPGQLLADLTPVMTGSSGRGSSQTELPPARTSGLAHGAVQVDDGSGGLIGCASVHLAGTHEHDEG